MNVIVSAFIFALYRIMSMISKTITGWALLIWICINSDILYKSDDCKVAVLDLQAFKKNNHNVYIGTPYRLQSLGIFPQCRANLN